MVKRIKKRVSKPEPTPEELEQSLAEEGELVASDEGAEAAEDMAPPAFAVEPNISMSYQDGFTEVAERVFVSVVDHWKVLAALVVIGAGVWSLKSTMQEYAHAGLAEERAQLSAVIGAYDQATVAQTAYLKQSARWFAENPNALTTPEVGEAPSSEALAQSAASFKGLKSSLSHEGMLLLAQLGEASARFDAAKGADDFKAAGELFMGVASQKSAEPLARASAYQSAAASFEQAQDWDAAARAWGALSALDAELIKAEERGKRVIFGLFAGVEQAKVQLIAGKGAEAKATLAKLEKDFAEALKDPSNKGIARELKITTLKAQ